MCFWVASLKDLNSMARKIPFVPQQLREPDGFLRQFVQVEVDHRVTLDVGAT
jgi:hypothetical protein